MKNNKKFIKGITLISLVVTIIVLLILAGISIMILTGNNGILNRANEAKEVSGTEQIQEELQLGINALTIDHHTKNNSSGTFKDYVFSEEEGKGQETLKRELGEDNLSFNKPTITYKGIEFIVSENGTIRKVVINNDPNQGFWINDINISTYSLTEVLQGINNYVDALILGNNNSVDLSEYGVSEITFESISNNFTNVQITFINYRDFIVETSFSVEEDAETGDKRVIVRRSISQFRCNI